MQNLKLNETPVRTAKNFNINHITLENIKIPEHIEKFENVKIVGQNSKIKIDEDVVHSCNLVYGLEKSLTDQVEKNANQKLTIHIDSKTNQEIQLKFLFDQKNLQLIDHIEIEANENTKATVILTYESEKEIVAFHNGVINLQAKKDSAIHVIIANFMNQNSNHFMSIQNELEENAKVTYTIIDFGGKNSVTNYYANLKGSSSDNRLDTIYLGTENQLFDLNYIGELRGQKSNINIEVEGALKDSAKKHFKGTIDFKKGCKKAIGNENENCMLLSDTAKSLALPMLLCSEEDVKGNHASSAGRIGEKELFYIMSRGFERKAAMKLMVRARFNKILENIKNEELKNKVIDAIDTRLD